MKNNNKELSLITIEDVIRRKEKIQSRKKLTKKIKIEELDGYIEICKADKYTAIDMQDMEGVEADEYLVYNCIVSPNLKSEELQKAFECEHPHDILYDLFEVGGLKKLCSEILEFSGYGQGIEAINDREQVIAEIKN